jgi:hypothetical protein
LRLRDFAADTLFLITRGVKFIAFWKVEQHGYNAEADP